MRLLHVVTFRLTLMATALLTFWSVLFYIAMMDEVNDEVDDSLEDYAEMIILRSLRGEALPRSANGTNNFYFLREVSDAYAKTTSSVRYADRDIFLTSKNETEPTRVLTYIYMRADGHYNELTVATPNIDKSDLRGAIAFWIGLLYVILIISIMLVNLWGLKRSMKPLNKLLGWLDRYRLGQTNEPLNNPTKIREFRKLNETTERSMHRIEQLYEQQKVFVGNASHEMQTPIAVCQNRIEMLLDDEGLNEQQMGDLIKVRQTLQQLSRQNKSLLMLCRIENGHFSANEPQNLTMITERLLTDYQAVYASQDVRVELHDRKPFVLNMDENLASMLVANLLKNAYAHNVQGGQIHITAKTDSLRIANTGESQPLDVSLIFQRFYHTKNRQTSTGLGLAMVDAICKRYGLTIAYSFDNGLHTFTLTQS